MLPCVYVCGPVYVCVYTRTSVCVYIHVLRMYTCLCVCIHLCMSVCTRVGTPVCISYYLVLSVYPSFLCVVSCYPIFHVIKRRPVTQLRLPPAACQGYLSSLRVLSAVSGRQIWALSVLVFQFLVHFTEDSRGAALIILAATSPGGFVFFSVVPILPALFHCCPPNTVTIGRHTPVTYAVLPAYYTVVLWGRLSAVTRQLPRPFCRHITPLYSGAGYRPSHASYLCRFAGMLHRCTLAPVHRPSKASYLCSFAGILHRCYLVPVNRPSHASRESGVAYLIGEVNCRCFSCMQRVMVGVCFPTLFSPSVASWFRRMVLGFFFLCLHVVLSHEKV